MKIIMLFLMFLSLPIYSADIDGDYGEDVSNFNCSKSIHQSRDFMASIKTGLEFDSEDEEDEETSEGSATTEK